MNYKYFSILLIVVGVILIISGPISHLSIINNIKNNLKNSYIITSSTSEYFDYIDSYNVVIYSYNVTNPIEVINGYQPFFEIIGPYSYVYTLITSDYFFSDEEESFFFKRDYYYDIDFDKGINSLTEKATTLQFSYLGLVHLLEEESIIPFCNINFFLFLKKIFSLFSKSFSDL